MRRIQYIAFVCHDTHRHVWLAVNFRELLLQTGEVREPTINTPLLVTACHLELVHCPNEHALAMHIMNK